MLYDGLTQEVDINPALGIRSKNVLPRIATLSNVVGNICSNHTSLSEPSAVKRTRKRPGFPRLSQFLPFPLTVELILRFKQPLYEVSNAHAQQRHERKSSIDQELEWPKIV